MFYFIHFPYTLCRKDFVNSRSMLRELNIHGIRWVDGVDLDKKEIQKILDDYEFHELDIEAAIEEHQRARIDKYPNYLFIVLHFPKYDPRAKVYRLNEFDIFL